MKTGKYLLLLLIFHFSCGVGLSNTTTIRGTTGKAVITGKTSNIADGEVVQLTLIDYGIEDPRINKKILATIKDNQYRLTIDSLDHPVYFKLYFVGSNDLNVVPFVLSPNDMIDIDQSGNTTKISGVNSSVYNCILTIAQEGKKKYNNYEWSDRNNKPLKEEFKVCDKQLEYNLALLKSYEHRISPDIYLLLKSDLMYGAANYKYFLLNLKNITVQQIDYDPILLDVKEIKPYQRGDMYSSVFPSYVTSKFTYDSCTAVNRAFDPIKCIDFVYRNFQGNLKEQLGSYVVIKNIKRSGMTAPQQHALSTFSNHVFRNIISEATGNRIEGSEAVNFSLPDQNGKYHTLSDYKGNIVVLDFWFTGCWACRELAPKLGYVADKLKNEKVVFLSISVDKSKDTWLKSLKKGEYTFKGCIELYTDGKAQSHPELFKYKILGFPTLILVDQDGKIMNSPISPREDGGADMVNLIYTKLNRKGSM